MNLSYHVPPSSQCPAIGSGYVRLVLGAEIRESQDWQETQRHRIPNSTGRAMRHGRPQVSSSLDDMRTRTRQKMSMAPSLTRERMRWRTIMKTSISKESPDEERAWGRCCGHLQRGVGLKQTWKKKDIPDWINGPSDGHHWTCDNVCNNGIEEKLWKENSGDYFTLLWLDLDLICAPSHFLFTLLSIPVSGPEFIL